MFGILGLWANKDEDKSVPVAQTRASRTFLGDMYDFSWRLCLNGSKTGSYGMSINSHYYL
jgi:hypothetical protein